MREFALPCNLVHGIQECIDFGLVVVHAEAEEQAGCLRLMALRAIKRLPSGRAAIVADAEPIAKLAFANDALAILPAILYALHGAFWRVLRLDMPNTYGCQVKGAVTAW